MQNTKTSNNILNHVLRQVYWIRILVGKLKFFIYKLSINGVRNYLRGRWLVEGRGCYRIKKDIIGLNNSIFFDEFSLIKNARIRIRGNNNRLIVHKGVIIGKGCSFWMEGNNCLIEIGAKTSITRDAQFNCQENNSKIIIGEDCMFSNNIIVRTSDSHPIYDIETGVRVNMPQHVIIGNHVWIAPNTKIMKGAKLGDGAIIGSDTTITGIVSDNALAIGRPYRIIKTNVR